MRTVLLASLVLVGAIALAAPGGKSQFIDEDWIEKSSDAYAGGYSFTQVSGDTYMVHRIIIEVKNGSVSARHWASPSDEFEERPVALKDVKIVKNTFSSAGLVGPTQSKAAPRVWSGTFIRRYPPANAKGPVVKGLLLGDWLFYKVD